MIIINKKYFINKDKYKWLGDKLEPNFELIIGDKSKIFYGFNGIGISSISKCLQEYNKTDNLKFLDYKDQNHKSRFLF